MNSQAPAEETPTAASQATEPLHSQEAMAIVERAYRRPDVPLFRTGDTVRVHFRIVEGAKERIQVFEGVVLKRHKGDHSTATFTVRKVSYNIGVERTFPLHSPRIEKIEVVSEGLVRRARLFYLRPLRGKKTRIKRRISFAADKSADNNK